jgi:hypothetical protein
MGTSITPPMRWADRHRTLAALRDLFVMPLVGLAGLLVFAESLWLGFGGTSASPSADSGFCGDGVSLLVFGAFAAWFGVVIGNLVLTGGRPQHQRALLALWNAVITAPLLFFVFVVFAVGVAACNE